MRINTSRSACKQRARRPFVLWLPFTSSRNLATDSRRVFFFAAIGLLFAIFSDLTKFGISGYPLRSVLLLAANDFLLHPAIGLLKNVRKYAEGRGIRIEVKLREDVENVKKLIDIKVGN